MRRATLGFELYSSRAELERLLGDANAAARAFFRLPAEHSPVSAAARPSYVNPDGSEVRLWSASLRQEIPPDLQESAPRFLLELATWLFRAIGGYGFLAAGDELQREPAPGPPGEGLEGPFWANFLGPECVEVVGTEVLAQATAFRRERFEGDRWLLLTEPTPWTWKSDPGEQARAALRDSLGEDVFTRRGFLGRRKPASRRPTFRVG